MAGKAWKIKFRQVMDGYGRHGMFRPDMLWSVEAGKVW